MSGVNAKGLACRRCGVWRLGWACLLCERGSRLCPLFARAVTSSTLTKTQVCFCVDLYNQNINLVPSWSEDGIFQVLISILLGAVGAQKKKKKCMWGRQTGGKSADGTLAGFPVVTVASSHCNLRRLQFCPRLSRCRGQRQRPAVSSSCKPENHKPTMESWKGKREKKSS